MANTAQPVSDEIQVNDVLTVVREAYSPEKAAASKENTEPAELPLWIEELESIWSAPAPMAWLVENLFPEKALIMIAGESGCGKSTLALSLAHAVATGNDFLDRKTLSRPVLIVDRENPRYVYYERTKRLHLEQTEGLNVWGLWSPVEPIGPKAEEITKFAKARQPLIIFDSLVAFHPGSEQDSTETRKYMHEFRKLAAFGATVLVLHHTGKGENTKEYRGSSDIKANVDLSFLLTSKAPRLQSLELSSKKVREGDSDSLRISFNDKTGQFVSLEDEARKAVEQVVREKPGSNQSEIITAIGEAVSAHKVREILKRGVEQGLFAELKGGINNSNSYRLRAA